MPPELPYKSYANKIWRLVEAQHVPSTEPPMSSDEAQWTAPDDYGPCLNLADRVRAEGCELIRYASVRHPDASPNVAVLTCRAFENAEPDRFQTWRLFLRPERIQAHREHPKVSVEFTAGESGLAFA